MCCNQTVQSLLFHPVSSRWSKKKKFSGSEVWPSFGLKGREVMHAKEVQRCTLLPEQDHQSTIICLSILLLPRLTFKVCNNSGLPLALSGSKVMHVFIIALGTDFRKYKSWMGWSCWENFMLDHIYWSPVMQQLKTPQVSRVKGKLLFPQGESQTLNDMTEQLLLEELYRASHYKRSGSRGAISKTKWETQVAPAGGPGAMVWESREQHSQLRLCTNFGK